MKIFIPTSLLFSATVALAFTPKHVRRSVATKIRSPSALNYIDDASNVQDAVDNGPSFNCITNKHRTAEQSKSKHVRTVAAPGIVIEPIPTVEEYNIDDRKGAQKIQEEVRAFTFLGSDHASGSAFTFLGADVPSDSAFTFLGSNGNASKRGKANAVAAFVIKPLQVVEAPKAAQRIEEDIEVIEQISVEILQGIFSLDKLPVVDAEIVGRP